MNTTPPKTCPKCGAPIQENAPQGLCPKCVLMAAATATTPTNPPAGKTPVPSAAELAPHFPELEIIELIGAGGMSAVYKARQPKLDRFVALKILSRDLARDPAFIERFNREAQMLARLSHPNIVTVYDTGTAGPFAYLLMEYVDGVNLRQAMRAGRFTPAETLTLVESICAALKFAHEKGILHRDIKPENILIDAQGRVKIADFGIAKLVGENDRGLVTLTSQGAVLGTPHYMAPEQFESPGSVDQRADIYSLGVVFYELLTGELPIGRFAAPSAKVAMDARIDDIVMRTLEKEREARFQSAEEVRTSVGAVVQNPGVARKGSIPFPSDGQDSARFSLAGAILTGLSLVGIIVGVYIGTEYRGLGLTRDAGKILMVVMMLLSAMTAIAGFIVGCVALGSIRRSGGVLGGLGGSVFAVATWPILLLGPFASIFLLMPTSGASNNGGGAVGIPVMLLCLISSMVFSAYFLVRGLRRWARGVDDGNGGKRFPGLGAPVLVSIGVMALVVVSLNLLMQIFPGPQEVTLHRAEVSGPSVLEPEPHVAVSVSEPANWRGGKPDLKVNLLVEPGFKAKMEMFIKDEKGARKLYSLGETTQNHDGSPAHVGIELGTLLNDRVGPESDKQVMTVLYSSGRDHSQIRSGLDLRGFVFHESARTVLSLVAAGTQRIPIATRSAQGQGVAFAELYLEVNVSKFASEATDASVHAKRAAELEAQKRTFLKGFRTYSAKEGRLPEWRLGEPEISLPVTLSSGVRAAFRLVLQDKGAPETIWERKITGPVEKPVFFELGTQLRSVSGPPGGIHALVVKLDAPQGGGLNSVRDLSGWKFNGDLPAMIAPVAAGRQEYVLATLVEDGTPPRKGTLTLEVTAEPVKSE